MVQKYPIPYYNGALTNTAVLVAPGVISLRGYRVENVHTALNYIQFFDKAAAADVTLGTTVPDWTLYLGPSAVAEFWHQGDNPLRLFSKGIVVAITATRTGNGSPTAAGGCHLFYEYN